MQVWLGCFRESGLHLPPFGPQFTQSRARAPPGLGLQSPEVAAQLGGSLPHLCSQPANLPPRDYIKQSPPPGCARGVARGRGWRGAGKDGCFPGLVIFPAAGWLARLRWGVDPDPHRSVAQSPGAGRRWGVGKRGSNPALFLVFLFHPRVLFSPTSSPVVGEVRRGRGRDKRHPGSPGLLGLGPTTPPTTRLWVRGSR